MRRIQNHSRALWQTFLRFIGHLKTVERIVELARSHAIEGSEIASIICAFGWAIPLCLYRDYLETSPYLKGVGNSVPQWLLIVVMICLFFYQTTALFRNPDPERDDTLHEQIRAAREKAHWLRVRGIGLQAGAFVWAFMAYLLSVHKLTPSTFIFGFLSASCLVGNYLVGELGVKTAADRESYLILKEQGDLLPKAPPVPALPSVNKSRSIRM